MERQCLFWNVQRLFDPAGLPVARELDATGAQWSTADYERKVFNVAACLRAATDGEVPAILGLAEVETTRVLRDLRAATGWKDLVIVDELVPDSTIDGLDVALMLDGTVFDPSSLRSRSVALDNRFSTRDLLEVRARHRASGQEVVLVVVHWPSRLIAEGEMLRFAYSVYLRRLVTSALKYSKAELVAADGTITMPSEDDLDARWTTPCIVMGDFNDEPYDCSVREALGCTRFSELVTRRGALRGKARVEVDNYLDKGVTLHNPCWTLSFRDDDGMGGTYYRSEWRTYDQVLVSHGALSPGACLRLLPDSPSVFRCRTPLGDPPRPVSMTTDSGYPRGFSQKSPEGVSDHFPLMFTVEIDNGAP